MNVKRTERGWAGHFICADDCRFRRNTLLQSEIEEVVISTVGAMEIEDFRTHKMKFDAVGLDRYYETMAFIAKSSDMRYHDIDVSKQVEFNSDWYVETLDADDKANDMHEAVVKELTEKMQKGELLYNYKDGDDVLQ